MLMNEQIKIILRGLTTLSVVLLLSACVTTSNSSLTDKADPVVAVERYVQLGLEYIRRNDLQRARKHLSRALEINGESAQANAVMGLVFSQEGELKKAEELYSKALELDPTYTRGRSYYGAFLYSAKRYDEALTQFLEAGNDTQYEGRAQIFSNIALCYLKLGQNDKAIAAYNQTLRLDRANGRALSGITELLILKRDYEQAQRHYNRLVRLIKDQGMTHSAQSLWHGVRLANYYDSLPQARALADMLSELYPDSDENRHAQDLLSRRGIR